MANYYLDTSIWIDHLEMRGTNGECAKQLILSILEKGDVILSSDLHLRELKAVGYTSEEIIRLFQIAKPDHLRRVHIHKEQLIEMRHLARQRGVPKKDALHAVLARDNEALMISRDRHFEELRHVVETRKPEDIH